MRGLYRVKIILLAIPQYCKDDPVYHRTMNIKPLQKTQFSNSAALDNANLK